MVTSPPDEHAWHWSIVALAGAILAISPMLAAMFGVATGPVAAPAIGVAAVITLAGCWAVVGSGDVRWWSALLALVGGAMICVPLAALEWNKRSPAPAAAAPFYTLATLPWVLVPLAGGVVGIFLGRRSAAHGERVRDPDRCPRYGYPLELALAKCPECGLDHSEARGYREEDASHRRDHPAGSLVLIVLGLILLAFSGATAAKQLQSLSYPSVVADSSEIFAGTSRVGQMRRRPALVSSYGYTVNGTVYLGERVSYSQWRLADPTLPRPSYVLRTAAVRHAARINAGGPRVYYNPADPSDSTLIVGFDGAILYRLFGALALVAWGVAGAMPLALGPFPRDWPARLRAMKRGLASLAGLAAASACVVVVSYSCIGHQTGGLTGLGLLAVTLAGAAWATWRTP